MSGMIVDIDEGLLKKAQELTGMKKIIEIVNYAIKKLVEQKEIEEVLSLKGKIKWEGDLSEMRKGRI